MRSTENKPYWYSVMGILTGSALFAVLILGRTVSSLGEFVLFFSLPALMGTSGWLMGRRDGKPNDNAKSPQPDAECDAIKDENIRLKKHCLQLEQMYKRACVRAETDPLTRLHNHSHFQSCLAMEMNRSKRYKRPVSLLMIDLDNFKMVNDRFGHQKGDEVLSLIGSLLKKEIRSSDYAARYGGEEFVVIMPEINIRQAINGAERIRQKIGDIGDEVLLPPHQIGASIGVADAPECASDKTSLISAADSALLYAKRHGRNRVAYFRDLSQADLQTEDFDNLYSFLEGASLQTIRALVEAVDARDQYQRGLLDISQIAKQMCDNAGLSGEQTDAVMLAAELHDIGKLGVPAAVLRKSGKLLPNELAMVRRHPELGQRIISEVNQVRDLGSAILYHHEHWDGNGYPEGLKGEQIPVTARIIGILDAYRAMCCDRPYRPALKKENAIEELKTGAGRVFDPALVDILISIVEDGPVKGLSQ